MKFHTVETSQYSATLKARFQRRNVNVLATAVSIAVVDLNSGFFGAPELPFHTSPRKESSIFFQKSDKGTAPLKGGLLAACETVASRRDLPRAIVNNKASL